LTVQLPSTFTDNYQLSIHDVFGRTIYQESMESVTTTVSVNMADYEHGVYYLELRAAGVRGIQKVVKQGLK